MELIKEWFRRHFSDPQVVILTVLLLLGAVVLIFLGRILAPVLAGIVIAYLLTGLVGRLEKYKVPRLAAVLVVFLSFLVFLMFMFFRLFPLLWQQVVQLIQELPSMFSWSQRELLRLPEKYPELVSEKQLLDILEVLRSELMTLGQRILSFSVASVRSTIMVLVYVFLIPPLVFFFLKDKERLVGWLTNFLPEERPLASEVWHEVDLQIGHYVRGKFLEILIIWAASYLTFTILRLQFAILLSFFVGLSVLVPYIGATVMTLPVASIAYFQWGLSASFAWAVMAYILIQLLDGHVLVPLLFSEVVDLHPVAIIVAVLFFGGIWGFWGVFFAIPLATLVQAIIKGWAGRRSKKKAAPGSPPIPTETG